VVNLAVPHVLPALGKARWTAAQLLGYEIALEGARQAIGYHSRQLADAEAADEPDADAIATLRAEQAAWAAREQDLGPLDLRAVESVRDDADNLLGEDADEDDEDAEDDAGEQTDDTGLSEQDGRGD
jgi:hypothetical protein